VARAVIELSREISPALPLISTLVEGCAYNPETNQAAFNHMGHPVLIEPYKIVIYGVENATAAREILDWLKEKITTTIKPKKVAESIPVVNDTAR
jgi:hypothetical protein